MGADDVRHRLKRKGVLDKLEIIGKVALPIVIGGATIWFNSQISERQQSAEMVKIAVGILSVEPEGDESDALRNWAVDILAEKGGLSESAAAILRTKALSFLGGSLSYSVDEENDTADFQIQFGLPEGQQ